MISSSQVTTSNEQQATESSLCDRNTTAGLSTQGKDSHNTAEDSWVCLSARCHTDAALSSLFLASVDSASLMVSEVADQDQTCSSEDLCSLEVQGSDSSPYGTLHIAPTDGSCTSLELCTRDSSRLHRGRPNTDARPSDTGYSESSHTQESLERSPDWSSGNFSNLDQEDSTDNTHPCEELRASMHICDELASAKHLPEEPPKAATHSLIKARMMSRKLTLPVSLPPPPQPCSPISVASSGGTSAISPMAPSPSPSPPSRPRGPRLCFSVWSPSSTSQPPSTSVQAGYSPSERPRVLRAARRYRKLARIVRSTSDPISCSSATGRKLLHEFTPQLQYLIVEKRITVHSTNPPFWVIFQPVNYKY